MIALSLSEDVRLLVEGVAGELLTPRDDAPGWTREELRKLEVLAEFRALTPPSWDVLRWQQYNRDVRYDQAHAWKRELWAHTTGAEREALIAEDRSRKAAWWASLSEAEQAQRRAQAVQAQRARVARMDETERAQWLRKKREAEKARRARWTPEERQRELLKQAAKRARRRQLKPLAKVKP